MTRLSLTLCLMVVSMAVAAQPRVKTVSLAAHTILTVDIEASKGTRFLFPFVLDTQDDFIPFTLHLTNKDIFQYQREDGRNSFVIYVNPGVTGTHSATVFVTVAGYTITAELHTTQDPSKYFTDIDFQLSDAQRETLIQKAVSQRMTALEASYKEKESALDALADQKALARVGALALKKPSYTRIKEEGKLPVPNGDNIILYVDEATKYEPYTIYEFEVSTDSTTGIALTDAKLFAVNPTTKALRVIPSARELPARVAAGGTVHGVLTIMETLNPKDVLKLQVLTDKGVVEAQW